MYNTPKSTNNMTQPTLWHITFETHKDLLDHLGAFSEMIEATFSWQEDEGKTLYKVDVILSSEETKEEVILSFQKQFEVFLSHYDLKVPDLHISSLENKDWLLENQASFKPIRIGSFYIHSSHAKDDVSEERFPIQIDAATAFGSVAHPPMLNVSVHIIP